MAVIQMGAIVTEIKGSVGGTAFKKQRNTQVMYRKSNGYSRAKLLSNSALAYARYIFTAWSGLIEDDKSAWANEASILFFPDKFGNPVHITARQLFTKCNLNLRNLDYLPNPTIDFTSVVDVLDVDTPLINPTTNYATVNVEPLNGLDTYVLISVQVSINNLQSPTYQSRRVIKTVNINSSTLIDFATELYQTYPYLTSGYKIRLYVEAMNNFGIKGNFTAVTANVI